MKIAVRYYSKGGKTKKLAEAVAKAVGEKALPVSEPLTEDTDVLFICTAPYAFDVDEEVKSFIAEIGVTVKKAVAVSSSAALKSIRKYMKRQFEEKGIALSEEEFSCRGEFLMLHRGKPDEKDLRAASEFAVRIAGKGAGDS